MAEVTAPAQAASAAAAGAAEPVHPDPPYTQEDDGQLEAGLQCYYPGCDAKFRTYGALLQHVTNVRGSHKRSMTMLKGTYLHEKGCKDINEKQKARYKQSKAKAEEDPEGAAAKKVKKGQAAIAPPAAGGGDAAASAPNQAVQPLPPSAHVWRAMKCWVKCKPDGTPFEPLEVCGLADGEGPAKEVPMAQGELEPNTELCTNPQPLLPNAAQSFEAPAAAGVVAISDAGAASSRAEVVPGPMNMLTDMWKHQKKQEAKEEKEKTWHHDLPKVFVKPTHLNHAGVPCKGEVVDGKKCNRADWPPEFSSDFVELNEFGKWLAADKALNNQWAKARCRDVGRFLGGLDCQGSTAESTECLVALGRADTYKQYFAMPLMSAKYSWPLDMVDSLVVYIEYHKDIIHDKIKKQDDGPWSKYLNILSGMDSKLKGGIRKKCIMQSEKKLRAKAKADEKAIDLLPPPEVLHAAVSNGYKCLIKIHGMYHDKATMPPLVRAKATTCVAGGAALDTYMGRMMEWTLAEAEYVLRILATDQEYLECEEHKTSKYYGDVYKWLSSPLKKAMILYSQLPKATACTKFFVPAFEGVEKVCLTHYLKMFCVRFLPEDKTYPTCNLLRKWFHSEMKRKSRDPESVKFLMMQVDPHGDFVMEKHYMLKSPKDHVAIAKVVYNAIMGEVTAWPSEEEAHAYDMGSWLESPLAEEFQEDQHFDEDNDYEEEGWEWGLYI